ncbi:glycosyltransferase [Qipengyuania spongiae]|uniref:Glycosyltransferase family 4 protein n=1 Tax=Qipengyuania spongiae TaxID=2909673 RepID=A0ABY5SYZ8_9SPHN|nr:glycosyltransferase family 4 protein [Qipengyuania spongiae]UVI39086.1 glycosyltransferase family 4 protein [Qipengyuania spongiae]
MKGPIAIVSKQRLVGATNGSSAYLIAIARSLAGTGHEVHLIQPSPNIFGRTPAMRLQPEMDVFASHTIRATLRLGNWRIVLSPAIWAAAAAGVARKLLRKVGMKGRWTEDRPRPYSVATPWVRADLAFVERHLPPGCSAVIADYIFCAPALALAPEAAATGIVMHDLFHARAGGGKDSVAIVSRDDEVRMLGAADAVLAIQQEEAAFVAAQVPDTRAVLVPMPAEIATSPAPGEDDRLLFVGSNTAPNTVGLSWFLEQVWPLVRRARPACVLEVAGTVDRGFEGPVPEGVRFLGLVPDLAPLYRDAGVVISPLTFGSGLKIKLVEAMAAGKAVVATSITLQGVAEHCGEAVICTDDAAEFAGAVSRLAGDRNARANLAERALASAVHNFSAETVHRELRDWADGRA